MTRESRAKVVVMATSRSRTSIHPSLVTSRGTHLLQEVIDIPSPDQVIIQAIYRLYTGYIQAIYRPYTGYIQAIYRLYTGYIQAIYRLYTGYIQAIYRLYTGYRHPQPRSGDYTGYI